MQAEFVELVAHPKEAAPHAVSEGFCGNHLLALQHQYLVLLAVRFPEANPLRDPGKQRRGA